MSLYPVAVLEMTDRRLRRSWRYRARGFRRVAECVTILRGRGPFGPGPPRVLLADLPWQNRPCGTANLGCGETSSTSLAGEVGATGVSCVFDLTWVGQVAMRCASYRGCQIGRVVAE